MARFGAISDAIWSYAELGLQEHKSSALLTRTLEAEGFRVERGLADMPTCFVASYGSGKPVIGILAEYDAYYAMPIGTGYGNSGVPDFLCCVNGRFVAVEAKALRGKATALQLNICR